MKIEKAEQRTFIIPTINWIIRIQQGYISKLLNQSDQFLIQVASMKLKLSEKLSQNYIVLLYKLLIFVFFKNFNMQNYQLEQMEHHDAMGHYETASKVGNFVQNQQEDDNESIGKFLSLSDRKRLSEIHEQKQNKQQESPSESSPEISYSSSSPKKPKRSPLHNFQKHFVTTLRRNVRIKWGQDDQEFKKAAKEIWHVFRNSKKYTKQFVYIVLGLTDPETDEQILGKYGLLQLLQKYGVAEFKKGQAFLRESVLEIFRNSSTEKIMYERRIQKKKEFSSYFYKILGEIEEGSTKKRLPKRRKLLKRNSIRKTEKK